MIEQRDLLLVPFPFSDQSGRKVRPVIALSGKSFNENSDDVLVVGVSSNYYNDRYTLKLDNSDLEEGKLSLPCYIKSENILKVEKEMIIKKIGKIKIEKLKEIIEKVKLIFE